MSLLECIRHCQESVTDPEKAAGRVSKDEKVRKAVSCPSHLYKVKVKV